MSVMVYTSDPGPHTISGRLFWKVLEHLENKRQGTFVLATCRVPPADIVPSPFRDWVLLPGENDGWGEPNLTPKLLAHIGRLYQLRAFVLVGADSLVLVDALQEGMAGKHLVLLSPDLPVGSSKENLFFLKADDDEKWIAKLDRWVAELLPVEILTGPDCSVREVLDFIASRLEVGRVEHLVIRWKGEIGQRLHELLNGVLGQFESPVQVELLSAQLFDVPRAGLAHTPLDFLFDQNAWKQLGRLLNFLAKAPAGVDVKIITDSRRPWIQASVVVANQVCKRLRSWLCTGSRGQG